MLSATPGTLVAATAKPYEFADSRTGELRRGTSYRLYVVPDFDSAPIELRANADQYATAAKLGMGAKVDSLIEISARDSRILYTCKGLELTSDNGVKAKV